MKDDSLVTHVGNNPFENHGIINPPVYHASTVLSPTLEAYRNIRNAKVRYGRRGTPTSHAFEDAIAALEGGSGAVSTPSGLAMTARSAAMAASHGTRRHLRCRGTTLICERWPPRTKTQRRPSRRVLRP